MSENSEVQNKDVLDVTTGVGLKTTPEEFRKLENIANEAKLDLNEYVSKLVRERINGDHTLELPQEELALLKAMATSRKQTIGQCLSDVIKSSTNEGLLTKSQAIVATLELAWNRVTDTEELQKAQEDIAADLLVAKAALQIEQTGTLDKEKLRELVKELCF